ncbi:hypothetical protein Q3G72_000238 [Acer saccharum]|nr:hypothetical protein Q3G72_000238 [Acer saccharum]
MQRQSDHATKDTFFFAKGPLIDGPWGESQYQFRRIWNRYETNGVESKSECDVAPARTQILLDTPVKQRSCRTLLTEGNLRPSHLWRWLMLNRSRALYPHVKDFVSYIWIRRSFEILQYDLSFLSPLTDIERRFVVTSMASAQLNLLDKAESIKLYRDELAKKRAAVLAVLKKKQAARKSKESALAVPEQILESSPERSPSRKRQKRDSVVDHQKKAASGSKEKSVATAFEPDLPMKLLSSGILWFKEPT